MTKEEYMQLPKEKLAELLFMRDMQDIYANGLYRNWLPTIQTVLT